MITIGNTTVPLTSLECAITGMRNPMNSWDKADSRVTTDSFDEEYFKLGDNDKDLALRLASGGPVHAKYRRMIVVYADIVAPLYWWKEFDTYKVGTVANSCSTMHKIHSKEFTLDDFSHEHLSDVGIQHLLSLIEWLNRNRHAFNNYDSIDGIGRDKKDYWWEMIQLLPSSYQQMRTVMLNYEVLHNIYYSRKDHKLDEWHIFCDWIKELPYSELILQEEK